MAKKGVAFYRQCLVAICSGLGGLGAALTLAYTSPALPSMKNDPHFPITEEEASWIGSIVSASGLIGSLMAGVLVDSLGRKYLSLYAIPLSIVAWVIIACSSSPYFVIAARLLGGLGLGLQTVAASVHLSECIDVELRGFMNIFPGLLWTMGMLFVNAAGKYYDWRGLAWLGATINIPSLLLTAYLPETPLYLFKMGKGSEALAAMTWLRDSPAKAKKELDEFESVSKESKRESISFIDLFRPPNRWPICTAITMHTFQQLTGVNALLFYSTLVFEAVDSPQSPFDPATCSIILTFTNVIANLCCTYLIAIWKRKYLIRFSSQLIIMSQALLAIYFYLQTAGEYWEKITMTLSIVPLLSVLIYITGFCAGWGPIPFIFLNEGLPSKAIGLGSALAISANWALTFLVTKLYFSLVSALGYSNLFLIFGFFTFLGMIFSEIYLPETLGRSLAQMDKFYIESYKKKTK